MATLSSLAIRRDDAFDRIEKELGINLHDIYHRNPAVMETLRIEAIADALEAPVEGRGAHEASGEIPPVTVETVKAEEMKTVETVKVEPAAKKGKG